MMECVTSHGRAGGNPTGILSVAPCETLQPVLYAMEEVGRARGAFAQGVGLGLDLEGDKGLGWGGWAQCRPGWDAVVYLRAGRRHQLGGEE